jgi:hypothetical protein
MGTSNAGKAYWLVTVRAATNFCKRDPVLAVAAHDRVEVGENHSYPYPKFEPAASWILFHTMFPLAG